MLNHEPATIREEDPTIIADRVAIGSVNEAAFGSTEESTLVERLRDSGCVLLSLVATVHGRIAGHILFSRITVETADGTLPFVALAPLAVLPEYQRRGIGGELVRAGLDWLASRGEHTVIVVGHPGYYPRFGFSVDLASRLDSPFPPDVFMALELKRGVLDGIRGRVRYPAAFGI